jgi:predicted lipid-binding transport protein (Tim44 family)
MSQQMTESKGIVGTLACLLLCAVLALAPSLAEARAGVTYNRSGGTTMSQGSRGMNTWSPNGGAPLQRSLAQSQSYGRSTSYYQSYYSAHPFWTGFAGGFFGSWLGSMMFPHWGMGMGYGYGYASVLGSILSWLLIIGIIWMVWRMFARRSFATVSYGGPVGFGGMAPGPVGYVEPPVSAPLAIAQADYHAFETVLKNVQGAWTHKDLTTMRRFVTSEMLSYFSEQLAEAESQGVENHCEDVELLRGDLREAWDEGRLQYATCYLQWRANDYVCRTDRRPGDPGYVVQGDPHRRTEIAELWTFVRSPGGNWLLSAIQQV